MKTSTTIFLDAETKKNVDAWLQGSYDQEIKNEIRFLLENNPDALIDSFYTRLKFGTGGLRGIMGIGSNRMNLYTVQAATQGLADTIHLALNGKLEEFSHRIKEGSPAVFIGYDSRIHSRQFAEEAASVLAGNSIKVYLCDEMRPTPLVSFGCRYYGCIAAIMITASHNPSEYNGYKVYWNDGAQVTPPYDKTISEMMDRIQGPQDVHKASITSPWIERVGAEVDEAYLESAITLQSLSENDQQKGDQLKIIYTSLHGAGISLVPQMLAMWGFTQLVTVPRQCVPDGHFPTVKSPNPEEPEAFRLGTQTLLEEEGDLLLVTDPDADRIGVVVRINDDGKILNGNQIACLCVDHVLRNHKKMPPRPACIKTIVTTELFRKICEFYNVACFDTLTGFKYIAELIRTWEENPQEGYQFLFGGEESYGYLLGTLTRDKDAVILCALISEIALQCKLEGKTLIDRLEEIYKCHGVFEEQLLSLSFPDTKEGREHMSQGLAALRENPPKMILGSKIVKIDDYLNGTTTEVGAKETKKALEFPQSDVITLHLEDKTQLVIRPSGTESKVKLYASVYTARVDPIHEAIEHATILCEEYLLELKAILQSSSQKLNRLY